ncbi:glycosyltransferase family 4 protein [Nocardioides aestuarii]|uniref:Glycosyltransferase family 4 protein n=1 Tax=Nocardioides aestuarii TaxID=252231 RepID=A0ABW4TT70_9ACTN
MRIALLSYRSKPHCGGQGVYVRHLSRELVALGHTVEVFSGPPYPVLDPGVALTEVPSLDLYREPDPFRVPSLREFRDRVDVEEFLTMCTAGFPEPKTFSTRVAKLLRDRAGDFDVVHDNQVLGHGMVDIASFLPMVTTIHHPITLDRRIDLAQATSRRQRLTLRRWYGFLRMQGKVARQMPFILTPSESSRRDAARDFGIDPERMRVVQLGVEERFVPPTGPRVAGRIMAMASADAPVKGIATLLEAFAKLRVERPHLELVLVSKPVAGGRTEQLIDQLGLEGSVRFVHGLSDDELVALMGSAELACVPSLYEGFSLPTAELMACATPLVVSRAGAIPEVVGEDGDCADLVEPGDVGQLTHAIEAMLDDPARRAAMGAAGRRRVEEKFSWRAVAQATAATYEEAIRAHR